MRILVLASLLLSGWAFGHTLTDNILGSNAKFEGKGVWESSDGTSGTWTNTSVFTVLSSEGEPVKLEVSDKLVLLKDNVIVSEENSTYIWDFTDTGHPNVYTIFDGETKIGMGACQTDKGCTSLVEVDGIQMAENLYFNPETKVMEVYGVWKKGDEKGEWSGELKPVVEKEEN